MAEAVYLDLDLTRVPSVAGVPRFMYREFLQQLGRWLIRAGRRDALALLIEEVALIEYLGFFVEARRRRRRHQAKNVAVPKDAVVRHRAAVGIGQVSEK